VTENRRRRCRGPAQYYCDVQPLGFTLWHTHVGRLAACAPDSPGISAGQAHHCQCLCALLLCWLACLPVPPHALIVLPAQLSVLLAAGLQSSVGSFKLSPVRPVVFQAHVPGYITYVDFDRVLCPALLNFVAIADTTRARVSCLIATHFSPRASTFQRKIWAVLCLASHTAPHSAKICT
jgi:hypothetical protein